MLSKINVDNFDSEVRKSKSPVLLASIYRGYDYKAQVKVLDCLQKKMKGSLKICLFNEDYKHAFKNLNIDGAPTYILLEHGKEKGRLLGKVDSKKLYKFVIEHLPELKEDRLKKRK